MRVLLTIVAIVLLASFQQRELIYQLEFTDAHFGKILYTRVVCDTLSIPYIHTQVVMEQPNRNFWSDKPDRFMGGLYWDVDKITDSIKVAQYHYADSTFKAFLRRQKH